MECSDRKFNNENKTTSLVFHHKKLLNKQLIRITYFAMAQSIIQYGLIAWGGCNASLKNKLLITN